ncbi:hypothetical protein LL06_04380 [Hoeflea sp. BAL378]|uniref:hypothetical protein n=1 Tax=Hoeflea sp. BAL378 TaxID=1547437 RepID=UPI000512AE5E|nr:hypothetical protein [Hoeflea sp. BAL378]KGF70602.1 hypothetical protein LL06_04380 [Hoeflea sp. BAL378]
MQHRFLTSLLLAVIGLVLALIAYAAPFGNTGVDGSLGALLALVGAAVTTAGAALLMFGSASSHRFGSLLIGLLVLAATLTAIASFFLMQTGLAVVMALAALALLLAPFLQSRRSAA